MHIARLLLLVRSFRCLSPVDDIGRMHVLHTQQQLIQDVLYVPLSHKLIWADDTGEIGVHKVKHEVQVTYMGGEEGE